MAPASWFRLILLLAFVTSCARSTSFEDEAFDDDEDAGLVGIGDDGGSDPNGDDGSRGDGGSSSDGGLVSDGGTGSDGGTDGAAPHPCEGVTCNSPPANTCADAQKLRVYEPIGACGDDGECIYQSTLQDCPGGCSNGSCVGAPCTGVSCNTPPANHCKDEFTAVHYGAGSCSGGACLYEHTEVHCPYGCSSGFCKDCSVDGDCGSGKYCNAGVCASCNVDLHCGATCENCAASNKVCHNGACIQCMSDDQCAQDEVCRDGACMPACSPTGAVVFSDAFTSPSSSSWTTGTNVAVSSSHWRAYTNAKHGVRINNGRLEITNKTSGSPDHGHGYAYVKTGGAGSAYDNSQYDPVLSANTGREIVWTLNMRRSNPTGDWATNGGFKCSSSSSQNGNSLGLAYVLAMDSPDGLVASTGTCSATATGSGYAVVVGGSRKVRLVRFTGGLRNGTITDLVASGDFSAVSDYFSVRVTYNANTHQWKLEARRDGTSGFSNPASGSYSFTGTAYDSTHVNVPLAYSGAYFQTGCCCLCNATFDAYFDNVTVTTRCAP